MSLLMNQSNQREYLRQLKNSGLIVSITFVIIFLLMVGCTSTNKKLETHPTTENTSELKALDKFWELLRPLRILNGAGAVEFN